MCHAVCQYDVGVACKELPYIKRPCAIRCNKYSFDVVAVNFTKDYIEFLCRFFVLRMHNDATVHAVGNVLPYAVEAVSATVIEECSRKRSLPCPCHGFTTLHC